MTVKINDMLTVCYDQEREAGAVVTHVHKDKHPVRKLDDNIVAVVDVFAFPRGEGQGRAFNDVPVYADADTAGARNDEGDDGETRDLPVAAYLAAPDPEPREEATRSIDASGPTDPPAAPSGNASTAVWSDYAREIGAVDDDQAATYNRDQLKEAVARHQRD